jgi:monofunctional biosynthetic peptidoglycan transglycosylase
VDEATRLPEITQLPPRPSLFGSFFKMAVSGTILLAVILCGLLLTIPDVTMLERCFTTSMFQVKLCPGSENYIKLEGISPYVIHAVIVSEDGSFYSHKGFDWHEISESVSANLRSGKAARGGSTLTQQLAKNVFLSADKSVWRKVKEAYLANAIEKRYGKNFILEKYLNVVEFGPNLYGIKAAAQHYFQTDPLNLNPLQSAYLAHLLPNPKTYSQGFRKGALTPFSRKSVQTILKRMNSFGKLNDGSYERSVAHLGEFPWIALGYSSFSGAPSYSLETDVPMPQASDLEVDTPSVENSLEESEPTVAAPEPVDNADEVEREIQSLEKNANSEPDKNDFE